MKKVAIRIASIGGGLVAVAPRRRRRPRLQVVPTSPREVRRPLAVIRPDGRRRGSRPAGRCSRLPARHRWEPRRPHRQARAKARCPHRMRGVRTTGLRAPVSGLDEARGARPAAGSVREALGSRRLPTKSGRASACCELVTCPMLPRPGSPQDVVSCQSGTARRTRRKSHEEPRHPHRIHRRRPRRSPPRRRRWPQLQVVRSATKLRFPSGRCGAASRAGQAARAWYGRRSTRLRWGPRRSTNRSETSRPTTSTPITKG